MADNVTETTVSPEASSSGSGEYQMDRRWGTIAMLISATGMGLVPLFSRMATRTEFLDGKMAP